MLTRAGTQGKRRKITKPSQPKNNQSSTPESEEPIQINDNNEDDSNSDANPEIKEESEDEEILKHKAVNGRYVQRNMKFVFINPDQIEYKPIILSDEDYKTLQLNIINDPIRGYFYYLRLADDIGHLLRTMTRKSGIFLRPYKEKLLKFTPWEQFVDEYRFIPLDREVWRKAARTLDMVKVGKSVCAYTKFILELLNAIYIGYTEGYEAMNEKISEKLVSFICKVTRTYTRNLNHAYHQLLVKEFNDFFNFQTGFGNSLDQFVKRESLYVTIDDDESLTNKRSPYAIKWTAEEKDIFYESLARFGISNIDRISNLLPNKSEVDIMNLYNALSKGLKKYKSNKRLKKQLLTQEDIPIAYEMSEEYIAKEEEFASTIDKLEDGYCSKLSGEYRGKHLKESVSSCRRLFNMKNLEKLLDVVNEIQATPGEQKRRHHIVEYALYDMYYLIYGYIYELMSRLFRRKMNELTIAQQFEWKNLIKSLKISPDPKKMVKILNLKNMDKEVKEKIDYFKPYPSEDEEGDEYDSDEADFYPDFTVNQWGLMMNTNPDGVTIVDKNDIWNIAITKDEVDEMSKEMKKEYNFSTKLWGQLTGKMDTEELTESIIRNESVERAASSTPVEESTSSSDDSDDSASSSEDTSSDEEESDEDEERLNYEAMLNNAQDIDELQSEDEMHEMMLYADSDQYDSDMDGKQSSNNKTKWYDDEFIIIDSNTDLNDKGMLDKSVISGVDLTTKGHEYIERLCDYEAKLLNSKDFKHSIKHENLLLTQLVSKTATDDLNDDLYPNFFSQTLYGEAEIGVNSWKPEYGGPPSIIASNEVKVNVTDIIKHINSKTNVEDSGIDPESIEKFNHTYNDY